MTDPKSVVETTLLDGRVRCLQPEFGYRIAIDTVLLAAAVPAKAGDRVLDVGAGAGAAGLCVATRVGDINVTGLEIQPNFVDLAKRNANLNELADHFETVEGDVGNPPETLRPDSFDQVISNPPYVGAGQGQIPPEPSKAMATMEGDVTLGEWITFCIRMAKTKGTITVVHRADRVEEIIAAMAGRVGELVIFPLWPGGENPYQPAKRVIVQGRKGMKGPTTMSRGLVLHNPGGSYTDQTTGILVNGDALDIRR